nr:MAG TPA: VexL [Caudoviricetes sp.]
MLKVNLNNILIDTVDSIQFYLSRTKDNNPTITKTYKKDGSDEVQLNNGYFYVPYTQEDTLNFLGMKMVYFGIQINFTNKSVSKIDYDIFFVQETIGTEIIENNIPSIDTTESYIEADFDVVYVLNISKEELQSYVESSKINADTAVAAKNDAILAKNDAILAKDAVEGEIATLKEDIGNIKKKKNVVVYVGSAELSDEQKLSCDYVCDGVDDQIEINQAISSLPDSGGEIHLSRGIFNITNTIYIRKRIKLTGEGKGITLDRNNVNNGGTTLLSEFTGGCVIQIEQSDTLSDIKGITLSDFQIVGAGINVENNYSNGINVTTYIDCVTLERLAICHCFYGLFVDQSATVDDISVTNCDFQRDSTGIYIYGQGWQTRIENNIFWDMSGRQETSGIVLSAGKNIVNGNYFGVSSLVYQGMACAWISAKNAVFLLCNGNSFSSCTSSPIRFKAGGQFASISGNSFYEIGKAQFNHNERAVLYVDGAGTGGGRISFTNNTVFWAADDNWKTSYLAYLTNRVAQVNISNNTVIDGIGKINENELVYKSEDSAYAITIGNNVLC